MSFITRSYLNSFVAGLSTSEIFRLQSRPNIFKESNKSSRQKTIFLSHSHKDKDLVDKAAIFLLSQGVDIYVDWKDSSMPPITSAETAHQIKSRIIGCDEFVVLSSNNALESKWVPWELGFADSVKNIEHIYILPIADNDGNWRGSEYFDLYQKIELGRLPSRILVSEVVVREPIHKFVASSFKNKLEQNRDSQTYYVNPIMD